VEKRLFLSNLIYVLEMVWHFLWLSGAATLFLQATGHAVFNETYSQIYGLAALGLAVIVMNVVALLRYELHQMRSIQFQEELLKTLLEFKR